MELIIDKYQEIEKNAKRGAVQKAKEDDFVSITSSFFDFVHINAQTLNRIEANRIFLHDQQTERKIVKGSENKRLTKKEQAVKKWKIRQLEILAQEKERECISMLILIQC